VVEHLSIGVGTLVRTRMSASLPQGKTALKAQWYWRGYAELLPTKQGKCALVKIPHIDQLVRIRPLILSRSFASRTDI
jgi:hypothetical protein